MGRKCEKSHDLQLILDAHHGPLSLTPLPCNGRDEEDKCQVDKCKDEVDKSKVDKSRDTKGNGKSQDDKGIQFEVYHSAPFDAFMTGSIHAHQLMEGQCQNSGKSGDGLSDNSRVIRVVNW
jgi:hypothetical protein